VIVTGVPTALLFVEGYPEFDTLHDEPAHRDLLAQMKPACTERAVIH
jgi:hypothetical protein